MELSVRSAAREEFVDVTERVGEVVRELGVREGFVLVYVPHTTAGVTINEGADPDVRRDMLAALARIVHDDPSFLHAEGNSPAHVKTSLMGSSVIVPVGGGRLRLGRWQSVYLCEFDGPRTRSMWVSAGGSPSRAK
ncbi:MAG: YjbQ family protein [Gemmatimonadetes bacterium]|nr:YjbQ family protein [Gemmatimonadota bacterium]